MGNGGRGALKMIKAIGGKANGICAWPVSLDRYVRFYSVVDLVNAQEKAGRIVASLLCMDLVILDERGCLPFS